MRFAGARSSVHSVFFLAVVRACCLPWCHKVLWFSVDLRAPGYLFDRPREQNVLPRFVINDAADCRRLFQSSLLLRGVAVLSYFAPPAPQRNQSVSGFRIPQSDTAGNDRASLPSSYFSFFLIPDACFLPDAFPPFDSPPHHPLPSLPLPPFRLPPLPLPRSTFSFQLKVGTNHLLGMNVVLPSATTKQTAGRTPTPTPRARARRPSGLPPRSPSPAVPPPRRSSPFEAPVAPPPDFPLPPPPLPHGEMTAVDSGDGLGNGGDEDGDEDGEAWERGGRARPAEDHPLQPLRQQQQGTEPMDTEPVGRSSGKKRPRSALGDGGGGAGTRGRGGRSTYSRSPSGRRAGGSVTLRDLAACGVQALDGSRDGGPEPQDENSQGGVPREPKMKRRRRAVWGLGFLRLWGRAGTADDDDTAAAAAAAAAAASTPAEAPGNQPQVDGEEQEPAHRGGGGAEGSDGGHHQQRGVRHGAPAGCREGDVSPSSSQPPAPAPPGPGGRGGDRTCACRGDATGGAPSSSLSSSRGGSLCTGTGTSGGGGGGGGGGEVPAGPLRRSPLTITVVLAPPPPASHGLENVVG